jgi:hypothetical protein
MSRWRGSHGRGGPDAQHGAARVHGTEIDRDDERRGIPSCEEVFTWPALGASPLVEDACTRGDVKARAAGRIARRARLQRGGCDIEGGAGSADVVEKWIIAQTGEDPKMPLFALDSALAAGIAERDIEQILTAVETASWRRRGNEIALDRRTCGGPARRSAAIYPKRVAHVVRKLLSDNGHDQIESPAIGRHPRVQIADVASGIIDDRLCIEMIRCRDRCDEERGKRQGSKSDVCIHDPDFNMRSSAPLSKSLAKEFDSNDPRRVVHCAP